MLLIFSILCSLCCFVFSQPPDLSPLGYNNSFTFPGDCPITFAWKTVVGNSSLIEMAMQAPTFGYISVAFTGGSWTMLGADAYWGYVNNLGVPVMQALYLGSRDIAGVVPNTRVVTLTNISGMRNGSYSTLFFTRNGLEGYNPGAPGSIFSLVGSLSSSTTLQQHSCYTFSTADVNFSATTATQGVGINNDARIAHGVLMGVSFSIILPLAIVIARYGRKIGGEHMWYYAHVGLQTLFFLIVFVAAILAYAMVGSRQHFVTWHGILGTVIWILVWLQYISGLLRPPAKVDEKKSKVRIVWEFYHAWEGRIIFLMACAAIVQGIRDLLVPDWAFAIWAPFYGFWFVIGFVLEVHHIYYTYGPGKHK